MDDPSLRDLLEHATVPEPPIGPIAQNALRAGLTLRRRRRAQYTAAGAAAIAVACAAAVSVTSAAGHPALTQPHAKGTVYVLSDNRTQGEVIPVNAATGRRGKPIVVRSEPLPLAASDEQMAVSPDGKTLWVADGDTLTPISTATNAAGKPVTVTGGGMSQFVMTPDGRTLYALNNTNGTVIPVSTITDQPGTPIRLGRQDSFGEEMAITPDGKTLYVLTFGTPGTEPSGGLPSYLIPVATATDKPGPPIRLASSDTAIVITPDGHSAYVIGMPTTAQLLKPKTFALVVTPIATATNTPGSPVTIRTGGAGPQGSPVIAPDGRTLYIPVDGSDADTSSGVVPFSTTRNRAAKMIQLGAVRAGEMAITPDGRTAYLTTEQRQPTFANTGCDPGTVMPISTATGKVGAPINAGCQMGFIADTFGGWPTDIAVSPDGAAAYVTSWNSVVPIATATQQPGKPIKTGQSQPSAILTTP